MTNASNAVSVIEPTVADPIPTIKTHIGKFYGLEASALEGEQQLEYGREAQDAAAWFAFHYSGQKFADIGEALDMPPRLALASIQRIDNTLQKDKMFLQFMQEACAALQPLLPYTPAGGRAPALRVSISQIQGAVVDYYRLKQADMTSGHRAREVSRPRQIAMYLSKGLTQRSLPEIGRMFGGRDHTTVIHAVRTIENLRIKEPELDADVRSLLARFGVNTAASTPSNLEETSIQPVPVNIPMPPQLFTLAAPGKH